MAKEEAKDLQNNKNTEKDNPQTGQQENSKEVKNEDKEAENTSAEQQESDAGAQQAAAEDTASAEMSETDKLKAELAEQKDKFLRMYSEFENYRRRTAKEKIEFMKSANQELMRELLPVLDDFERAEKSFGEKKEDDPVREGFQIIYNKLQKTLEKQGLKPMEDTKGKELDTELHEAITQYPAPDDGLKGKIIDQVEKGYFLGDKVIRYAKVVVGT